MATLRVLPPVPRWLFSLPGHFSRVIHPRLVHLSDSWQDRRSSGRSRVVPTGKIRGLFMSRRKRIFGPLTFATLLAWALVGLYSGIEIFTPRVQSWLEERNYQQAMRSRDDKHRQSVLKMLEREHAPFVTRLLVQAVDDPSTEVRLEACRVLAGRNTDLEPLVAALSAAAADEKGEVRAEAAHPGRGPRPPGPRGSLDG